MWEYLVIDAVSPVCDETDAFRLPRVSEVDEQEIVAPLSDLGKEGWELCGVLRWSDRKYYFYFKRPLVEVLPGGR